MPKFQLGSIKDPFSVQPLAQGFEKYINPLYNSKDRMEWLNIINQAKELLKKPPIKLSFTGDTHLSSHYGRLSGFSGKKLKLELILSSSEYNASQLSFPFNAATVISPLLLFQKKTAIPSAWGKENILKMGFVLPLFKLQCLFLVEKAITDILASPELNNLKDILQGQKHQQNHPVSEDSRDTPQILGNLRDLGVSLESPETENAKAQLTQGSNQFCEGLMTFLNSLQIKVDDNGQPKIGSSTSHPPMLSSSTLSTVNPPVLPLFLPSSSPDKMLELEMLTSGKC
ncbi:hypothetical protein C8R42DRAFT_637036 [Lentinula raphanica]|nr:hypothetical protein C8R42DRAFT_637036 [Lentinula raphanica]